MSRIFLKKKKNSNYSDIYFIYIYIYIYWYIFFSFLNSGVNQKGGLVGLGSIGSVCIADTSHAFTEVSDVYSANANR